MFLLKSGKVPGAPSAEHRQDHPAQDRSPHRHPQRNSFSSSFLLSSPELSDTKAHEPEMRALLGTGAHFWEVVVLKS